ncbi:MAG: Rrf2 family transcriptional regulator [Akkermansiaceae bacterium]|nr:Rrf2 family transcriptional regulator [Akkermansia sp.]MCD7798946.1 Rrf2 family transcriptional regulator [Akkermansiaceae bacterium]MCD8070284.1 Rrf2 family transcriptional regulator [Akkermansiaceae bacterium]
MLRISTKGRYALRVMLDLARQESGRPISLKDVGERQKVTVKYLESIMAQLVRGGFVSSLRGKAGGYRLAVDPAACTVGRIVKCMEGDMSPVACLAEGAAACPLAHGCDTLPFWKGLQQVIDAYLESATLADLLHAGQRK